MRTIITIALVAMLCAICVSAIAQDAEGLKINAYMQNRAYALPGDALFVQSERISLAASHNLPNNTQAFVEFYHHPWLPAVAPAEPYRTYLESAYVDTPLGTGRLRMGKGRALNFGLTPTFGNRKTSNYGIVSEMFTQDRVTGLQYYQTTGDTYLGLTAQITPRIGHRSVGDPGQNAIRLLADRDVPADQNRLLSMSGRVSHNFGGLRVGASASLGSISDNDLTSLNTLMGTGLNEESEPFTSKTRTRLGLDATYRMDNLILQSEYYPARTSSLNHNGWYVLAGMANPNSVSAYARYSRTNIDIEPNPAAPATWDKSQVSLSLQTWIRKGQLLILEHEMNEENGGSANNNVTFLELISFF